MTRAVAYSRNLLCAESGDAIPRGIQDERMKQFAADHGIEIVGWFADDTSGMSILKRPGIQALLACDRTFDVVLCERAWALSRSMTDLEPFFQELDRRGLKLRCSTLLWDRVSQQCRRRSESLPVLPRVPSVPGTSVRSHRYHVARPVRMNFAGLVHQKQSQVVSH